MCNALQAALKLYILFKLTIEMSYGFQMARTKSFQNHRSHCFFFIYSNILAKFQFNDEKIKIIKSEVFRDAFQLFKYIG